MLKLISNKITVFPSCIRWLFSKFLGYHEAGGIVDLSIMSQWKEGIMTTALDFILRAKKWPLGRKLVTAVDTAANPAQGAQAVRALMVEERVTGDELKKDKDILWLKLYYIYKLFYILTT